MGDLSSKMVKRITYSPIASDRNNHLHLSIVCQNVSPLRTQQKPNKNAMQHLKLFSEEDNFYYWIILFLEMDPLIDNIKDHPDFRKVIDDINIKFRKYHKQMEASLQEKDLI